MIKLIWLDEKYFEVKQIFFTELLKVSILKPWLHDSDVSIAQFSKGVEHKI